MMRKISLILLILCMVVSLCACAKPEEQPQETQNGLIILENGLVVYQVTAVDEMGNPMQDVVVQLGEDEHDIKTTNALGFVEFTKEEGNYQVKVLATPAGYAVVDDAFPFSAGKSEMRIIVPKA